MPENGNKVFIRKRDLVAGLNAMLGKEGGLTDKTARSIKRASAICDRQMENRKYSREEIEELLGKQMKRTELKIAMSAVEKCLSQEENAA